MKLIKVFVIFFTASRFIFFAVYSQSPTEILEKGDSLAQIKLHSASIDIYKEGLERLNDQKLDTFFILLWRINKSFGNLKNEKGKDLFSINFDAANFFEHQILKYPDRFDAAFNRDWTWAHVSAGNYFAKSNNYHKALIFYKKAYFLNSLGYKSNGTLITPCFGDATIWKNILKPMNKILNKIGDHNTILQFLSDSLLHSLEDVGETKDLVDFYIQKGICHFALGENQKAEESYVKALEFQDIHDTIRAIAFQDLGLLKKNKKLLRSAEETFLKNTLDPTLLSENYLFRGYISMDERNFEMAIQEVKKGISILKKKYKGVAGKEFTYHYYLLAEVYDSLNSLKLAESYYQKSFQILSQDSAYFLNGMENSNLYFVSDRNYVDALLGLARIWASFGKEANDIRFYNKSLEAYKLAVLAEEYLSSISLVDESRSRNANNRNHISELGLSLAYDLWAESKEDSLLDWAFFFMEKSRARELYSQLDRQKFYDSFPKLDTVIKEINLANFGIRELKRRLGITNKPEYEALINQKEQELINLNIRFESLIRDKNLQGYLNNEDSLNLLSFKTRLDRHTSFIYFSEGEKEFYALGITNDSSFFFKVPKDSIILEKIYFAKSFNKDESPSEKERIRYQKESFELYQSLLAPFTNKISAERTKLVMSVPTLSLYDFPFESLLTEFYKENAPKDFNQLSYLWQKFQVIRAYSASLYLHNAHNKISPKFAYTGFAPTAEGLVDMPLIYHKDEVNHSSSIFNSLRKVFQVFLDRDATKEAFFKVAENSEILHLALHSFSIADGEKTPYLQFSWDKEESNQNRHNNRLYLYELYPLALHTRLVIISACNSGQGEYIVGEGIDHFGRGFRLAGAANALISLWQLNDQASSELVPRFLYYLQEGYSKSEALNLARRDFFEDQNKDNDQLAPYFWANLVLEADAYPIYNKSLDNLRYWILGVIFGSIILAGLILGTRMRRRRRYN